MSDDDWKNYKPGGVPGCEKLEEFTQKCVQKALDAEKECKACTEAAGKGDLAQAQVHAKNLKQLEKEVKEFADKVKEESERLKKIHAQWQPEDK